MAAERKQPAKPESTQGWVDKVRSYIDEHRREMRLVTWPSREQVQSTTVVVIATVAFFGVYFGIVDYILALGQTRLYQMFSN
ncbi:MAG: preprotein translocase subunit SecE [Bryobacterales bacterium]|nr:preprotein translocase subunit SecE [Bryobacterales bacterium]